MNPYFGTPCSFFPMRYVPGHQEVFTKKMFVTDTLQFSFKYTQTTKSFIDFSICKSSSEFQLDNSDDNYSCQDFRRTILTKFITQWSEYIHLYFYITLFCFVNLYAFIIWTPMVPLPFPLSIQFPISTSMYHTHLDLQIACRTPISVVITKHIYL